MTAAIIHESTVEDAALAWFGELGYAVLHGPDITPEQPHAERATYSDVVLVDRLRSALAAINPAVRPDAREDAIRKVLRAGLDSPSLCVNNHRFHRFLVDGVPVAYQAEGRTVHDQVWLVDFENPETNDWLAVNQFTVIENKINRRPDVVVFVNGLPLGVIELKNPADENATVKGAFNQLQTYKHDIPGLFPYNEVLVVSDGVQARAGTLTADWDRFMPWRTVEGEEVVPKGTLELYVLIRGMFEKRRLLDLIQSFVVFEVDGPTIIKKMAGYHQFHAVNKAVASTVRAVSPEGDRRVGVVWHTQGSGKSLTMAFYAGKLIRRPELANPTLVVITDRNDLDDQLFGTFAACHEILRQRPEQAQSREHLRQLLNVASGGVVFTTIQKFVPEERGDRFPQLSDRRNIVVIADEAHRSQYDFIDGFARHLRDALPNASYIGFTGTPIEADDRSTPAVFGPYLDAYDIQRSVEDGATVPIFYESRLAKIELNEAERPRIDPDFEDVTEGEELEHKEKLKSRWARLEAMVGTPRRIELIARDIVQHFEQRLDALEGKGMVVCMSRRICVELYDAIIRLRPDWHDPDDNRGQLKVVMTGSAADPVEWQPHIRTKARREDLAKRFGKDPDDPFRLVIVRDMWLTGFDAPPLHTMYLDKPMRGHGLLQAIARVNRVFRDKPGGLVVDYLGLGDQLREALAAYTAEQRGETGMSQEEAVATLLEKYEVVAAMFHGFDYSTWMTGTGAERLALIPAAMEHILSLHDGKKRFQQAVTQLSKAFALAVPHEDALALRDDIAFFQTVRAAFAKTTAREEGPDDEHLDEAIRQIVSRAVVPDGVVDLFVWAGLPKPDIVSILSDSFLQEVRELPQRHLALEVLRKLIADEIKVRSRRNVVQARSFAEMLEQAIWRYKSRLVHSTEVIEELIQLAHQMQAAQKRGEDLGLTEDELAFYDALAANESAIQVLGNQRLRTIARELVEKVRRNATIDWTVKESVRAKLRLLVKRTLIKYGYPPDKREQATLTVLEQAERLSQQWAA